MARADFRFVHRIRVRWGEVDPQGVVFNARYLDYADIALTEYWREARAAGHWGSERLETHAARAEVDYRRPVLADEEVDLLARTARVGRTSFVLLVEIHGSEVDDLRAEIAVTSVNVDLNDHRPRPLPAWFAPAFAAFDAGQAALASPSNSG